MAKPKIGLGDIKNAIDFGKEVLPYVEPAVKKYAPIVAEQFAKKAEQAGGAKYQFNSHQCGNQRYRHHRRCTKEYPGRKN